MRLQLLLMQLLLCVLPGMEMGASCRLTAWVVEDSSGKVEITCIGDTMDIVSPDGLSLWYKERLTNISVIQPAANCLRYHKLYLNERKKRSSRSNPHIRLRFVKD